MQCLAYDMAQPRWIHRFGIDMTDLCRQGAILQYAQGLLGQHEDEQIPAQAADAAQQWHAVSLAHSRHAGIDDQCVAARAGDLGQNLCGRARFAEGSAVQMGLESEYQFASDPGVCIGDDEGGEGGRPAFAGAPA
ncbi:hypothetical protein R1V99_01290 [Stenotrophomonas maltophilia]|nr:hypothetical protein [Stenotrophomonas sp. Ps181]MDW7599211.1 hypothetical protein [Stenotrophomonas maltophilia]